MENKLGRRLRPDEEVHHKNENPIDDEIWNLEVLPIGVHTALHRSGAAGNRKNDYRLIEQMMSEGCGCRKISKRTKIPLGSVKYAMKAIRLKTGA